MTSCRLSSRVTDSCWPRDSAWPRRSKIRQAQPSAAMARALSRYCSWLPPQPWTRSVPGLPCPAAAGAISVPSMLSPLTGISIASVRSSMRLHDGVFDQRPGLRVHAAENAPARHEVPRRLRRSRRTLPSSARVPRAGPDRRGTPRAPQLPGRSRRRCATTARARRNASGRARRGRAARRNCGARRTGREIRRRRHRTPARLADRDAHVFGSTGVFRTLRNPRAR